MRETACASYASRTFAVCCLLRATPPKLCDSGFYMLCIKATSHVLTIITVRGVSFRCGMIALAAVHVCRLFGDTTMSLLCMSTEVGNFIGAGEIVQSVNRLSHPNPHPCVVLTTALPQPKESKQLCQPENAHSTCQTSR